jgi:hypothetical protein
MATLLIFIGIISLLIFVKFIYDSYLTDKTEKDWNQYKRNNPEDASRIEKNKKLNSNLKYQSGMNDKQTSLLRMAMNMQCSANEVKEYFINDLIKQELSVAEAKETIQIIRQKKIEESKVFNIEPEDTAAAYMEEWAKEFFENNKIDWKEHEIAENLLNVNPELARIINEENELELKNFLEENSSLLDSFIENLAYADEPAKRYRDKAIEKMYEQEDYADAIHLINKGLDSCDYQIAPTLYSMRAECNKKLLNFNDALNDINKAVRLISTNIPDNYYSISQFYRERAEIKVLLGDYNGARQDEEMGSTFHAKFKANETDDDVELPF